ncbi:MAG: sugar ABC transporter permease [Actinobacteria bacterium]|nr:MAG: sugar ABC transporter permease [Actinomycetota bacterium]
MGIGRRDRPAGRSAGPGDPDRQPAPVGVSTKTDAIAARAAGATPARRRRTRRRYLTVAAFMSPWIVGFLVLYAYPMLASLYYSFTKYDGGKAGPRWTGLSNYRFMFAQDPNFWLSLRNTIWMVLVSVPLAILLGVGSAYVLTKPRRGRAFYRTAFFLPTMVPAVAAAVAFLFLLNAGGPIDRILGFFHLPQPLWFFSAQWSKPGLVVVGLWGVGSTMIIFLAALLDVPAHLYEAADIEGANAWHKFRRITLPMISPVIFFTAVIGVIYVWLYQQGFESFHLGYASAMAWMLFAIVMGCTLVLIKSWNRWVFYQGGFR